MSGLVKGALYVTLPPQDVVIVSVPVAGRHPVVNVPVRVYAPLVHGPGVAVRVLQLGAVKVVGNIDGPPAAEKTAVTVQFVPLPQRLGME